MLSSSASSTSSRKAPSAVTSERIVCFCKLNNHGASLIHSGQVKRAADLFSAGLRHLRKASHLVNDSSFYTGTCLTCQQGGRLLNVTYGNSNSNSNSSHASSSRKRSSSAISSNSSNNNNNNNSIHSGSSSERSTSTSHCNNNNDNMQRETSSSSSTTTTTTTKTESRNSQSCRHDNATKITTKTFVFMSPITVQNSATCQNISFARLSFVLLYNLALSFDMLSMLPPLPPPHQQEEHDHQPDNSVLFRKKEACTAINFYQLAYKILNDGSGDGGGGKQIQIPMIYTCGLYNNMARLYQVLHQPQRSQRCLSALLSILMFYQIKNRTGFESNGGVGVVGARRPSSTEHYYLTQFLQNTTCLVLRNPITASAA